MVQNTAKVVRDVANVVRNIANIPPVAKVERDGFDLTGNLMMVPGLDIAVIQFSRFLHGAFSHIACIEVIIVTLHRRRT